MRLDMDCVRSILLCVEENTSIRKSCRFVDSGLSAVNAFLGTETIIPDYQIAMQEDFDNEKIIYHVRYCIDAGLLYQQDPPSGTDLWIFDLTPSGHEFLSNIRKNSNWEKTKSIGTKVGAFGLDMAKRIAEGVVTSIVKSELGLF